MSERAPGAGDRGGSTTPPWLAAPHPAVRVAGGVVDDVSEVRLIFDRGSLAEALYRLDVATARRVTYDLREAAADEVVADEGG